MNNIMNPNPERPPVEQSLKPSRVGQRLAKAVVSTPMNNDLPGFNGVPDLEYFSDRFVLFDSDDAREADEGDEDERSEDSGMEPYLNWNSQTDGNPEDFLLPAWERIFEVMDQILTTDNYFESLVLADGLWWHTSQQKLSKLTGMTEDQTWFFLALAFRSGILRNTSPFNSIMASWDDPLYFRVHTGTIARRIEDYEVAQSQPGSIQYFQIVAPPDSWVIDRLNGSPPQEREVAAQYHRGTLRRLRQGSR